MIEAARSGEVVNAVAPSRPQVCLIRSVRVERIIGRRCLPNESGDSPRSCIKQLEARSPLLARNTKTTPSFTMGAIEVCAVEMLAVHKPFACAHLIFDPALLPCVIPDRRPKGLRQPYCRVIFMRFRGPQALSDRPKGLCQPD